MPAMFRIVQDDHPPYPPDITTNLESFLNECFQKDPNRRINAKELLKHAWLKVLMLVSFLVWLAFHSVVNECVWRVHVFGVYGVVGARM